MHKINLLKKGIPISPSLDPIFIKDQLINQGPDDKKRILIITFLAFLIAISVSFIAKLLIIVIDLFTNISFFGSFSFSHSTPANNTLGIFVILIPTIGGVIIGLMALYGSKAIRGHGIPEAMEQILTNDSKIKPSITYLKPLSSAVAIGTGGPFGAEGPIIATGGALGSTIGQLLKISPNERKILLSAGATAGMSAIFGSPIAAIFLAIELLLFEFSPRSIIPVAVACITGAAGHHLLYGQNAVFEMKTIDIPNNSALFMYSLLGAIIGVLSIGVTKALYIVEEGFEKLPIHWMWWPAIGGFFVGLIGYFIPSTLGVGYENISNLLTGTLPLKVVVSLCVMKFISWVIALGSGTSGGTLAPILTIGGAIGALLGAGVILLFPQMGISISLAALIGMASLFAGSSRALLTSIVFALETTMQTNALLPLLGACLSSYLVSFFLMENTIMTEKIARRGVKTPQSFEPDLLGKLTVKQVFNDFETVFIEDESIQTILESNKMNKDFEPQFFIIANTEGNFKGILNSSKIYSNYSSKEMPIGSLLKENQLSVGLNDSLRLAAETMSTENVDALPVVENNNIIGIITYYDILKTYKQGNDNHKR